MREDWAEKLRRKLEGHRKTPPPGLWEGISKEMGFEAEPVSKPAVMKRWHWAAAAAVLALVGFFVFYNSNDIEQPQLANAVSQQPASEKLTSEQPITEQPVFESPTSQHSTSFTSKTSQTAARPLVACYHRDARKPTVHLTTSNSSSTEPEQVTTEIEEEQPIEPVQTENESNENNALKAENTDTHTSSEFKGIHPNKWSLGVNASGGLLAANTSQQMTRLYYYSMNDVSNYNIVGPQNGTGKDGYTSSFIPSYTLTEYRSEHHLPIRFGLSLNYQLTPRIALHSGISYTYLYSEFSIPLYKQANYDQKLHYLGIPVGISWQLWKTNRFQFYVSGGAMLEKCVNAEVDGNSVSKKPWQWSVDAAAGAEYSLIPQLGFYLEPSLGYYFDDNTALEHYYKKHPLTPTIEFGLRLHLNK